MYYCIIVTRFRPLPPKLWRIMLVSHFTPLALISFDKRLLFSFSLIFINFSGLIAWREVCSDCTDFCFTGWVSLPVAFDSTPSLRSFAVDLKCGCNVCMICMECSQDQIENPTTPRKLEFAVESREAT